MSAMPAIFVLRVMAVLLELGGDSVFDEWILLFLLFRGRSMTPFDGLENDVKLTDCEACRNSCKQNNERRAAAEVAFRMVRIGVRCMFRCYQTIAAN